MAFSGPSLNLGTQRSIFASTNALQQREVDSTISGLQEQADEVRENAFIRAMVRAKEIRKVREKQALNFADSGVLPTEGTPAEVLNETVALGQQELDFMIRAELSRAKGFEREALRVGTSARARFLQNTINFNNAEAQTKVQSIQSQGSPFISFFSALGSKLSSGSSGTGSSGSSLFNSGSGSKSFFRDLFSSGSSGGFVPANPNAVGGGI